MTAKRTHLPFSEVKRRGLRVLPWVLGGMAGISALCCSQVVCLPAWILRGVRISDCPDGDFRQDVTVTASSLRRGGGGTVMVEATAVYALDRSDEQLRAPIHRLGAELFLVDAMGEQTPLEPVDGWDSWGTTEACEVELPMVDDGDYKLRARVSTPVGDDTVDVELPLYAPARIHVLTDRPLYQPGDTAMFRALVLRATDLAPLENRPGTWQVRDTNGELLLEEKGSTGPWGVLAGSFPIDSQGEVGAWTVSWVSASDSAVASFQVEPFKMPRFKVEATADQRWYHAGDTPVVRGKVVYSSGAPVGDAEIEVSWSASGDWPPPTSWMDGGLPDRTTTDANGAFVLRLPQIPGDLLGRATLSARVSATDPAGDRVNGGLGLLFSEDAIQAEAVTELAAGLVEGFNNRMYLRVTTPDGAPLTDADVLVKRAWDPTDEGVPAHTDEDGVASLQIDPGAAVNVVIPAPPVRPPPPRKPVQRSGSVDLRTGGAPSLADQLALDRWTSDLESCARWVDGDTRELRLGLVADASGAIADVTAIDDPLALCFAEKARRNRLAPGVRRVIDASWRVEAPDLPSLTSSVRATPTEPTDLRMVMSEAALDARSCLPDDAPDTELPRVLSWRSRPESRELSVQWLPDRTSTALALPTVACLERTIAKVQLPEKAREHATGTVSFEVGAAPRLSVGRAMPTTMLGYELKVAASSKDEPIGSTVLRLTPGAVPPVRLRATPVLAEGGDEVEVLLLRGPDFSGELPESLWMQHEGHNSIEAKLDPDTRIAKFRLPAGQDGWYEVNTYGARALVYVEPAARLELDLSSDRPRYAPGETATITLRTREGRKPVRAGVGLFGVDESLGQLVPLPGPDNTDGLLPAVTTDVPAFGVLDGQALSMGRVRGRNAAAATVLRVSSVPAAPEMNPPVSADGRTWFDPVAELTDRFYGVLGELHEQTRVWEKTAPKDEQMQPATMAGLWKKALGACADREEPVTDAYGRRLRLHRLPSDLLALTDPRAVVVDSTRLPEDIVNWAAWVAEEQP